MDDPRTIATLYGYISIGIGILIPAVFWLVAMRPWKPRSRIGASFRFSLWPILVFSFQLGGPISRELLGIPNRYTMGLDETLRGLIGIFIFSAPVFFAIGWWKFRNKNQLNPPTVKVAEISNWWKGKNQEFRKWAFGSTVWACVTFLFFAIFDPFNNGSWLSMDGDEMLQMIVIMFLPFFAWALKAIYDKWIT